MVRPLLEEDTDCAAELRNRARTGAGKRGEDADGNLNKHLEAGVHSC